MTVAVAVVVGAALLAVWLDFRLDGRRPTSPMFRIGHALAAFIVLRGVAAGSHVLAGSSAPAGRAMAALFLLLLPGLVYAFLAGLWLMRTLAEVAHLSRR